MTEKGTSLIDMFTLRSRGPDQRTHKSDLSGKNSLWFPFASTTQLVVTEVENRFVLKATVSSYLVDGSQLSPVSPTVPDQQSGACWVAITGTTAWVVNTGTAVISAYQVGDSGQLTSANGNAAFHRGRHQLDRPRGFG